ncbi:MAG: hypothetical protein ACYC2O_03675 [Microthrixaceae bacterium]
MGSEAAGLAPMVSALQRPAAVIDAGSGRLVAVNQLFAALFPRLAPLDLPDGAAGTDTTAQQELCRGCGQVAELELTVNERLRDGGSSVVLVTCGVGAATALEIELRGLLADVDETVLLVDDTGIVRFASDPFDSLVGGSRVGAQVVELFDAPDRDDVGRLVADSLAHPGRRIVARGRLLLESGDTCWVEAIARGMTTGTSTAGVVLGLRVVSAASHLGVVATPQATQEAAPQTAPEAAPQSAPDHLDPASVVAAFRALTPSEKAEVIRSLRS